jgi:hypothetical protein
MVLKPSAPATAAPAIAPDLGPDIARIAFPGRQGIARTSLALRNFVTGPVLLPDMYGVTESIWAEVPRAVHGTCADRWIAIHSLPAPLARLSEQDGSPMLAMGGAALTRLPPDVPFLLQAKVTSHGLSESPAATAWTRAWNLEARDAEAFTRDRPAFYRALNLRGVAVMLEGLVRESFEPRIVGEAIAAFLVPKR